MTLAIPDTEPLSIRAGDSLSWSRSLPEYSAADGWTLKYRILWTTGSSPASFSAAGVGTQHTVTLAAVTLALALVPAMAACSTGPNAPTTDQGPSGGRMESRRGARAPPELTRRHSWKS